MRPDTTAGAAMWEISTKQIAAVFTKSTARFRSPDAPIAYASFPASWRRPDSASASTSWGAGSGSSKVSFSFE